MTSHTPAKWSPVSNNHRVEGEKMKRLIIVISVALLGLLAAGCGSSSQSAASGTPSPSASSSSAATSSTTPVTLTIFGAGTLATPFTQVDNAFMKLHPNVTIQAQFGGSVKMAKQVTELHQIADVVAVADYHVIPKYMFATNGSTAYSTWYAGFVTNAITFVYTSKSKYANEITPQNWYKILAKPGVQIGRSSPNTDPSGYQILEMMSLAEKYYHQPGLEAAILKNSPQSDMRDTETELIAALQSGQIDYLAMYRSDALQNGFKYLQLPPQINLSDAQYASSYATVSASTTNGPVTGAPIVYAATVPTNAAHPAWALQYLQFLFGPQGQSIMKANGFNTLTTPYASDMSKIPAPLASLVAPWPNQ